MVDILALAFYNLCMHKFKKYSEVLFLILLNLLFISNEFALLCIMYISKILSIMLFNADPSFENDWPFAFLCLLFVILYLVLKIILFPVLYSFKNILPYTHKFFDTIFSNKKYTILCFVFTIIILSADAIFYFIASGYKQANQIYIETFGLGLLPSYLIMYFVVKKHKKQK